MANNSPSMRTVSSQLSLVYAIALYNSNRTDLVRYYTSNAVEQVNHRMNRNKVRIYIYISFSAAPTLTRISSILINIKTQLLPPSCPA